MAEGGSLGRYFLRSIEEYLPKLIPQRSSREVAHPLADSDLALIVTWYVAVWSRHTPLSGNWHKVGANFTLKVLSTSFNLSVPLFASFTIAEREGEMLRTGHQAEPY